MSEKDNIDYKEKLFKQFSASKVFEEIFDGLKKEFGTELFISTHRILHVILEKFAQDNKTKLLMHIISKQGEVSALGHFIVENELVLSDEIIRRLQEMLKKIYIGLFCLLEKVLDEEENKTKESGDE